MPGLHWSRCDPSADRRKGGAGCARAPSPKWDPSAYFSLGLGAGVPPLPMPGTPTGSIKGGCAAGDRLGAVVRDDKAALPRPDLEAGKSMKGPMRKQLADLISPPPRCRARGFTVRSCALPRAPGFPRSPCRHHLAGPHSRARSARAALLRSLPLRSWQRLTILPALARAGSVATPRIEAAPSPRAAGLSRTVAVALAPSLAAPRNSVVTQSAPTPATDSQESLAKSAISLIYLPRYSPPFNPLSHTPSHSHPSPLSPSLTLPPSTTSHPPPHHTTTPDRILARRLRSGADIHRISRMRTTG